MKTISYSKLVTVVASLLIVSGCESTAANTNSNGNLSGANQALNELINDASCTASFQCKVLEVGQRACGGPSRYVIYSTLNTTQEAVEQQAAQVTKQEQLANENGTANDCLPVLPVQALCIDKQCQSFDIK